MKMERLFAGLPVRDFEAAIEWYGRLFDRDPDVVAHEHEVLWRVADTGWVYVIRDEARAGQGLIAILVPDLDAAVAEVEARGITAGPINRESESGRKATLEDPDGNSVALIAVSSR
jgi:predicted enzyme related to lactoylglutathione lyase